MTERKHKSQWTFAVLAAVATGILLWRCTFDSSWFDLFTLFTPCILSLLFFLAIRFRWLLLPAALMAGLYAMGGVWVSSACWGSIREETTMPLLPRLVVILVMVLIGVVLPTVFLILARREWIIGRQSQRQPIGPGERLQSQNNSERASSTMMQSAIRGGERDK